MNNTWAKLLAVGVVASVGAASAACSAPYDGTILIGVEDAAPAHDPATATQDAAVAPAAPGAPGSTPASASPPTSSPPATASDDAGAASMTPAPPAPSSTGPFDQFQERNLSDINQYRATLGIAPLVLDQTLCAFALAGSDELSQNHSPHAHFISASDAGSIWSAGFNSSAGENQGDPNGWTVLSSIPTTNELDQIDAIQKAMFDEGPGAGEAHGHYTNMMDATFTKVGVGLLEVGGALYLTNDFSN